MSKIELTNAESEYLEFVFKTWRNKIDDWVTNEDLKQIILLMSLIIQEYKENEKSYYCAIYNSFFKDSFFKSIFILSPFGYYFSYEKNKLYWTLLAMNMWMITDSQIFDN